MLDAFLDENQTPVSYRYVYIDAAGKLACFDLEHGVYEVRSAKALREKLMPGVEE